MNGAIADFYWKNLGQARRVLDVGCGEGGLGRFKPDNAEVYGLDKEARVLEVAGQFERVRPWDLESSTPLPFDDGFFDGVVAKDILEHVQQPWITLREIRRVLRPGGCLLVSVICERGSRTWSDYTHVRGFTRKSLTQLLRDQAFEVNGVWRMGGVPLTSRLNLIPMVPFLLRFPPMDWCFTSSYEAKATRHG